MSSHVAEKVTAWLQSLGIKNGVESDDNTASVIITGVGRYTGTITKTFTIVPKGTSILEKIAAKEGGFTVRWRKQAKSTTGYQIQYSSEN